jgi:hypothetical protein
MPWETSTGPNFGPNEASEAARRAETRSKSFETRSLFGYPTRELPNATSGGSWGKANRRLAEGSKPSLPRPRTIFERSSSKPLAGPVGWISGPRGRGIERGGAMARRKRSDRWEDLRPMMIREAEDLPSIHVVWPAGQYTPAARCDHESNLIPDGSGNYCPVCHQSGWDHYLFGKLVSELERQARQEPIQEEITFRPAVA